jgi:hypothetical protein
MSLDYFVTYLPDRSLIEGTLKPDATMTVVFNNNPVILAPNNGRRYLDIGRPVP